MTIATLLLALTVTLTADASHGEPVLLDFHASWCGPCQTMKPEVAKLARKGYPVKSVDFDRSPELVKRYEVTAIPTFIVIDSQGEVLARTQGVHPAKDLATLYNDATTKVGARAVQPTSSPSLAEETDTEGQQTPPEAPLVNPRPWETVVRIKMHLSSKEWGFGSGTIIYSDPEESIILTCAHIFRDSRGQAPLLKNFRTPISVDLFDGKITNPKKAMLQCVEKDIVGEAIDYDFSNDVGLIRIRPGRRLPASRVVPASWKPQRDMKMYSVGCSHGSDATAWPTRILDPRVSMKSGNQAFFEMKCETQPAEGRSGGGLYTTDGYVAGVCDFADPNEHVGLYAVPAAIHRLLDRNQFTALYQPPTDGRLLASANPNQTLVRAQSHDEPDSHPTEVRNFTIPEPDRFKISAPETKVASNTTRTQPWQNSDSEAPRRSARTARRPDRDAGEAIDPGARIGSPLLTDLAMEPSAESTIRAMPDLKSPDQQPAAELPAPRRPSTGKWTRVHSTERGSVSPN